jgi:hypothetical protein
VETASSTTPKTRRPAVQSYSTTTYAEEVEIVPDLPAGITKENASSPTSIRATSP